jgi:hypothetical protein
MDFSQEKYIEMALQAEILPLDAGIEEHPQHAEQSERILEGLEGVIVRSREMEGLLGFLDDGRPAVPAANVI